MSDESNQEWKFNFSGGGGQQEPGSSPRPGAIHTRDPLAVFIYLLAADQVPFGKLTAAATKMKAMMKQFDNHVSLGNATFATACAELALVVRGEGP